MENTIELQERINSIKEKTIKLNKSMFLNNLVLEEKKEILSVLSYEVKGFHNLEDKKTAKQDIFRLKNTISIIEKSQGYHLESIFSNMKNLLELENELLLSDSSITIYK